MKISDIALSVAVYLGKTAIADYLSGKEGKTDTETLTQIDAITRLSNLVINEVAGSFIPMVKTEEVTQTDGKIDLRELTEMPLEIKGVYLDESGVSFKVKGAYAESAFKANKIKYSYIPHNYGLTDEIGYTEKEISLAVLAFGVAAEYCLTEWRFAEAVMWRERFTEGIKSFCIVKNVNTKGREWL